MIESFEEWIETNQQKLSENQVTVQVHRSKIYNPKSFAAAAEFFAGEVFGNIIVWNTGLCDVHVLKNDEKYETIFTKCYELNDESELFDVLKSTFDRALSLKSGIDKVS